MPNNEAFRWTESGGLEGLGTLTGGSFPSAAYAVSADGTVVVGASHAPWGIEAFAWTEAGGMQGLGDLPGEQFYSSGNAVSADGTIVVGNSTGAEGGRAFIWDSTHGMRSLQDVVTNDLGLGLADWTLKQATGVSDDGLTIVGNAHVPGIGWRAYVVHLPEPSTLLLLGVGCPAVLQRRR